MSQHDVIVVEGRCNEGDEMNWDEYLMGFAKHAALKSKDATKVGAALVSWSHVVLLTAYNGPPMGVEDAPDRFERPRKYLFASHAEANLIAFAARMGIKTQGCRVYTTHMPCASCARTLIQAGIDDIVYGDGKTSMPQEEFDAAKVMLEEAWVNCRHISELSIPSVLQDGE